MLEDGFGVLMEEAAHVAVLPGEQAFQEADVAALGCDEQCDVGRLLGSLNRKGWRRGWRGGLRTRLSPLTPHSPLSLGPKASRFGVLTTGWGEGVICCIEAEHRYLDGIHFGSWACCLVVGSTVFIAKGHSCVAFIKLTYCAGLWVVEGGIG